ncbi:MAG: hypothetical protein ABJA82_15065 [Myxococcales bacterium]
MTKQLLMSVLLGTVGFVAGCGSNGTTAAHSCVSAEGLICQPSGFPFVTLAGASSDACAGSRLGTCPDPPLSATTARLSTPEAGKLCLSGTVAANDGWAKIVFVFTAFNLERSKVLKVFDADALGITQVAFTIDSPPNGGVTIDAAVVTATDCPAGPRDCFTQGFDLMTPTQTGILESFTAPGPQVALFTNFKQTRAGVSQIFDTSALQHLEFIVGQGVYNFCIHDLKFLDAAGNEVKE